MKRVNANFNKSECCFNIMKTCLLSIIKYNNCYSNIEEVETNNNLNGNKINITH